MDLALRQVKKKMTCEDFIKNNRGINDGENLPEEFLRSLYASISENEIKISSDGSAGLAPIHWEQIAQQSVLPRAQLLNVNNLGKLTHDSSHLCDHVTTLQVSHAQGLPLACVVNTLQGRDGKHNST